MKKLLTVISAILVLTTFSSSAKKLSVKEFVTTTMAQPWAKGTGAVTGQENRDTLTLSISNTAQTIKGFGVSFSELSAESLALLSEKDRKVIFDELFIPEKGANLVINRTPIAANDFALGWYSYDETDGDFEMRDFSIDRDKKLLIPLIQEALKRNPKMQIWAVPWCPPSWLKRNHHYAVRSSKSNGLAESEQGREGEDLFIQDSRYFEAYALYFQKYVKAYREQGIDIFMVMPQNEMNSATKYPGCCWTASGMSRFLEKLCPKMEEIGVDVYFGTHERPTAAIVDTILTWPGVGKYIKGVGFQWGGKKALPVIAEKYPELDLYQTEQECGNGKNDWSGAKKRWSLFKYYLGNGVSVYDCWNLSLKSPGRSHWGWSQNSLITVNAQEKTYEFTIEYYLLKHFSHYVLPGAKLLRTPKDKNVMAFRNVDGSVIVVAANFDKEGRTLDIKAGPDVVTIFLQPESFSTVKLTGCRATETPVMNPAPYAAFADGCLADITPKGWIKEFLERQACGLSGHPEAMSYPFNTNLWNGRIERMSTHGSGWWRYEQTGYYSDGLLRLGYLLGREDFIRKVEDGVNYTIAHARPGGEIGDDAILEAPKQYMWPQAVYFRVMKAMYEKTPNPAIPATLEKYYLHYSAEQIGHLRNIVNIEGMLWTYGITRNKALLELAEKAYEIGEFELRPYLADEEGCPHMHGVTYNEQMKIPAILYMWTGKEEHRRLAEAFEQKLVSFNMLPDGVPSSAEFLLGNNIDNAHESCDIADFTWAEGYFLEMSGDGKYADHIEKAVFNALPGAITKDFKAIQYLSNMNQFNCCGDSDPNPFKKGRTWQAYRPVHETECCVGNISRVLPNYVSRMWLRSTEGGIVAALYGPSEFRLGNLSVEERTNYPFDGKISFVFHADKAVRQSFAFHIPGWCRKYSVSVNGDSFDAKAQPGEFVTIRRSFKEGDVIELNFDMPVRFSHPSSLGISVERGPLLFAYHIPEQWEEDTIDYPAMRGKKSGLPDFKCWNIRPAGRFNYGIEGRDFTVVENPVGEGSFPFDNPPVIIRIKVNGLVWDLVDGKFTPSLPVNNGRFKKGDSAYLDLVPYGCTQLRLSVFPDLGRYR